MKHQVRGQALVEFGLVAGLFMLVVGGLVQFGVILWSQNAITQIARDTARYAVTLSDSPCDPNARPLVAAAANEIAQGAALIGYSGGLWSSAPAIGSLGPEGIGVDWDVPSGYTTNDCPPSDNRIAVYVRIRVNHVVPIFVPGLQLLAPPCSGDGFCLTTETDLRMEPKKR
jgi:TadE-like protein